MDRTQLKNFGNMKHSLKILLYIAFALLAAAICFASCTKQSAEQLEYDQPATLSISVDGDESITVRIK